MDAAPLFPAGRRLWPFLAALLAGKLLLLAALGPAVFPDSGVYLDLGREILRGGGDWLHDGGWDSGYAPLRLSRPYGYPLLIALAGRLAGEARGLWLLAAAQAVASVAAFGLFAALAGRLLPDRRVRAAVLLLGAVSQFLLFDLALLTDAFYAALFGAILLTVAAMIAGLLPPRWPLAALLGLGWAASLTLRDVGLYHSLLPALGLALAARRRTGRLAGTAGPLLAFLLPVGLVVGLTMGWNLHRTGHAVFSITGGVNWLWPSVNIADRHLADPFDCADLICRTVQSHGIGKGMGGVLELADRLWRERHLDAAAFGHLTFHHFLGVAAAHPLAFLASVLGNVQFDHLADLAFNPLSNASELVQMHSALGWRPVPGLRELSRALAGGQISALPLLLASALLHLLALAAFAAAAVLVPVRALRLLRRGGAEAATAAAMLFLWLAAAAFIGSYSLVHMEMRHALPTVPLILLAAGWLRRAGKSSPDLALPGSG